jgi:hypothetical protein
VLAQLSAVMEPKCSGGLIGVTVQLLPPPMGLAVVMTPAWAGVFHGPMHSVRVRQLNPGPVMPPK